MNSTLIIAIGGTGQLVLHYYLQRYLTGRAKPFDAIVIDVDKLLPPLEKVAGLLDRARPVLTDVRLPSISYWRPIAPGGKTIREALAGNSDVDRFHPANAFFGKSELEQSIAEGLFARPALSSLVKLPSDLGTMRVSGRRRIITVSSVVGGTGGGLTGPILASLASSIRTEHADETSLRSVFFGEYFQADVKRLPDAAKRFPSNVLFVLRTLQALAPAELDSFSFVSSDHGGKRDTQREVTGDYLPWPGNADPIWTGVDALPALITETTRDRQEEFAKREITLAPSESAANAATLVARRVSAVNALIDRRVIEDMSRDPVPETCWGPAFPKVLKKLVSASATASPGNSADAVCRQLQGGLQKRWSDVRRVFPSEAAEAPSKPADIVRMAWDPNALRFDAAGLRIENPADFAEIASSVLLLQALREESNVGASH